MSYFKINLNKFGYYLKKKKEEKKEVFLIYKCD